MLAGRLQTKGNYFYIVLSYKEETGKRKEIWIRTGLKLKNNKHRAEAMLLYYRLHFNVKTRTLEERSNEWMNKSVDMRFGDYLLLWVENRKNEIELTTYQGYKRNIENIIAPYFNAKNVRLNELTARLIDEFYEIELKRGISPNTVIRYHANIRKALQDAHKEHLVVCNCADKAHKPKSRPYMRIILIERNYLNCSMR